MIGKIFKNQDPMMGLPIETVPVIEDCYRAYKNFVKDRFNEELVYPTTESKAGGDAKSQVRRHDLDRLSAYSK